LSTAQHAYGPRVHLAGGTFVSTALARASADSISRTDLLALVRSVYEVLLASALEEFPRSQVEVETRMADKHPKRGVWRGDAAMDSGSVVICDVIRAGILPAQLCFERLSQLLPNADVRLDHLNIARTTDESGCATGADLSGSKVGGTVEGSVLLLPDPMGATGATTLCALSHYFEHYGRPAKIIAMPMICTPEYLRAVLDFDDGIQIHAGRLDRGLSAPEVLRATPGERWAEEVVLDDTNYIVPGAGGVGELLNNSWC
jgi:uracil phosphoribosyltransferase